MRTTPKGRDEEILGIKKRGKKSNASIGKMFGLTTQRIGQILKAMA